MPIYAPLFSACLIVMLIIIFPCFFASFLMIGTFWDMVIIGCDPT